MPTKHRKLTTEEHLAYRAMKCRECGAAVGQPCWSLKNGDDTRVVQHYHISRVLAVNLPKTPEHC